MSTAVPDFTRYANEVQQVFKTYDSFDDRTAHNNSIKVRPEVDRIFEAITVEIIEQSHFEAKAQALSTTIEIAEWIIENPSAIGHDIRQDLPWMALKPTISYLLEMLLPEELAALQADGEIPTAISNLRWRAQAYALDLRIDDLVERLWLEESDQKDEDETHMAL